MKADVRARIEVGVVHFAHDVRLRDVQHVDIVLQRQRVISETLTAVVGLFEALPLQQRTPRPVDHEDAIGVGLAGHL